MTPDEYMRWLAERLEAESEVALQATLNELDRRMTESLPASRVETRRAITTTVGRTSNGYRGTVGLRFSRQYRMKNTKTERLFRRSFRKHRHRIAPQLRSRLIRNLRST